MQNQFLNRLFNQVKYKLVSNPLIEKFNKIQYDSRKIDLDDIFVALIGSQTDGHDYIQSAIQKGAKLIIAQKQQTIQKMGKQIQNGIGLVLIEQLRLHLGIITSNFYDWPQRKLKIIGVTGTNGKTTTTYLIQKILGEEKTARIGTIEYKIGKNIIKANNTTPESLDILKICHRCVNENIQFLVMQVSSHGLQLGRVQMLQFDVAVFTNLTTDHLDFHKTIQNYFLAKRKLFTKTKQPLRCVINTDDIYGKRLFDQFGGISYGQSEQTKQKHLCDLNYQNSQNQLKKYEQLSQGHIQGKILNFQGSYQTIQVNFKEQAFKFKSKMLGKHNMYNMLAAIGTGIHFKISLQQIVKKLQQIQRVPGRFQSIDAGQDFNVIVDYAHTGDGLSNVLKAIIQIKKKGRIITVFGCGGERAKQRRYDMGAAASKYSNFSILTTDNSRNQSFEAIISDIKEGFKDTNGNLKQQQYQVIEDRKKAIQKAIDLAQTGDFVLIAGKGHETTQKIGNQIFQFDDKIEAEKILNSKLSKKTTS